MNDQFLSRICRVLGEMLSDLFSHIHCVFVRVTIFSFFISMLRRALDNFSAEGRKQQPEIRVCSQATRPLGVLGFSNFC